MEAKPDEFQTRIEAVGPWKIRVKSFRLGSEFICTVDNVDPGAIISRSEGRTREEAEAKAVEDARKSVAATRKGR